MDDDEYPIIKKFFSVTEEAIAEAEQYVIDLTEGRKNYRKEAQRNGLTTNNVCC